MTKLLSIITINYNNANGLKKTVKSVVNQTLNVFEYIIVDGSSDDGSVEIIESLKIEDLSYIIEPDSGIYNAMNKGITKASGEYLLFLNSGDVFLNKDSLDSVIKYLDGNNSFVGCNLVLDYPDHKEERIHPENISFSYLLQKTVYHPSTFIKRAMFETYGLYDETYKIVSDWEFFFKTIGLNGESFLQVSIALTLFDMSGLSSEQSEQVNLEREEVLNHYLKSFKNSPLDAYCLEQLRKPSSRTKLLVDLEKHNMLRKTVTVFLKLISKFS